MVPSYRGATFLDPKGRGAATGYDTAVALPAAGDDGDRGQGSLVVGAGGGAAGHGVLREAAACTFSCCLLSMAALALKANLGGWPCSHMQRST